MEPYTYRLLALVIATTFMCGCNDPKPAPEKNPGTDPQGAPVEIPFGVYTSDKPTEVVKELRPTLDALEAAAGKLLGKPVKISISVSATYEGGIEEIASGKVHISRPGPASYVTAKEANPNLALLVMESKKGAKVFNGIICVHNDSPIQSLAELKGKRFAFGDELSTIGRFLSQEQLRQAGVLAKDLASYKYLGRHDAVGAAVGAGDYDAGALKESTFKKLKASGTPIRELVNFPNVTKPWIVHPEVPEEVVAALRKAMLELSDETALAALGIDQFLEASDEDFVPTRESMKNNALFFDGQ